MLLKRLALVLSLLSPGRIVGQTCLCSEEPHYDLAPCPSGVPGCLNLLNRCRFPAWPVITTGSPPTLLMVGEMLQPGAGYQWIFPAPAAQDWAQGGRIYFYYKDPASIEGFPVGARTGMQVPGMPGFFAQLVEFTLSWDPSVNKGFLDVDVSNVDSTALPLYIYAGSNCNGVPGQRCSNAECNKVYSACAPEDLYNSCPCFQTAFEPSAGIGQCRSPRSFCADPTHATHPCCSSFDQPKYHAIVSGSTNVPEVIYGCQCDHVNCTQCAAINRGICVDPSNPSACPPAGWDTPANYYMHGLDENRYSAWIHQRWNNSYGFSLDEGFGGGNTQCRYGTQLDVVLCPSCTGAKLVPQHVIV